MKLIPSLILGFLTLNVACHKLTGADASVQDPPYGQESPQTFVIPHTSHKYASNPAYENALAISEAEKEYTNGLVAEAFTVLLNSYENTHDLQCLEFASELTDRQIDLIARQCQAKDRQLESTLSQLRNVSKRSGDGRSDLPEQVEIANEAYTVLRSDIIENYAKDFFIPRTELVKSKMVAVQAFVFSRITNPNNGESDRLIILQKTINDQRELLRKLRVEYISRDFIGPRVKLGDNLVYLAKFDKPHVGPVAPGVNSYWITKLELMFPKDYGAWIAQSDESTRMAFRTFVNNLKNALGEGQYKDFQDTIELLSNNKEGGIDSWWPAENAKP